MDRPFNNYPVKKISFLDMFHNFKFKKWITWGFLSITLLVIIGFAESQQTAKHCKNVIIDIDKGEAENFFVTKADVERLLNDNGQEGIKGKAYTALNFKELESRVLSNRLVKNCQVARDLKGDLLVELEQHRPIARITFTGGLSSMQDLYVSKDGSFLPMSEHYTSRVMLLSGIYFEKRRHLKSAKDQTLLALLNYIEKDPFWKAQLAQAEVNSHQEVTFIPQIGNHRIDFGSPEGMEAKFEKIKIFYKNILPAKGWGHYSKVTVKYRNQIVCE